MAPRYGDRVGNGRSGKIRTCDPLLPKQMRYQAALRSERGLDTKDQGVTSIADGALGKRNLR
jgi:hypothetical protein